MYSNRLKYLILVCMLGLSQWLMAGEHTFLSLLQGNQIFDQNSMVVEDALYTDMEGNNLWQSVFVNHRVNNYVLLQFTGDETDYANLSTAWSLQLNLKVEYWDHSQPTTLPGNATNFTVEINFDPATRFIGAKAVDVGEVVGQSITGRHKYKVTIDGPPTAAAGSALPPSGILDDISLEAWIKVERYFVLDEEESPELLLDATNAPEAGEFSWNRVPGAEEYDLEYLYVDDQTNLSTPVVDFANATRITTSANHYETSMLYHSGLLYYRIRAVGMGGADYKQRIEGPWSHHNTSNWPSNPTVSTPGTNSNPHLIADDFSEDMNWSFQTSFSGDGKKKETVTYADGTGRTMQAIAKNNTENLAIVAEQYYDFEGRSVIRTLPVPATNGNLSYHTGFNLSGGSSYAKENFDAAATYSNPDAIDGGEGADYFSPDNPNAQHGSTAFLPDAGNYAFTQTRAGIDGQIKKQGGAGPDHRIGSGHETEVFRGAPWQAKLDQLFGNEVGLAKYYRIEIAKDANGQHLVSYRNLRGQVIARALAGDAPQNASNDDIVDPLASNMVSPVISTNFNDKNEFLEADEAWVVETEIFVNFPGTYTFDYSLTSSVFTSLCSGENYDCAYDLSVTVFDEWNEAVSDNGQNIVHTPQSFAITGVNQTMGTGQFTVTFGDPGNYRIRKALTVNQAQFSTAVEEFRDDLLDPLTTCMDDLASYQLAFENSVDESECEGNCDSICVDYANSMFTPGSPDHTNFLRDCQKECLARDVDLCEGVRRSLAADMNPAMNGQYFNNLANGNAQANNGWLSTYLWGDFAPEWTALNISDPQGNLINTWDGLRLHWNSEWADNFPNGPLNINNPGTPFHNASIDGFVTAHPEYCHFQFCEENASSNDFDENLKFISHTLAETYGYINPQGVADPDYFLEPTIGGIANTAADPFFDGTNFATVYGSALWWTEMETRMNSGFPGGVSMWAYAETLAGCNYSVCPAEVWDNFVLLYVSAKASLIADFKGNMTLGYGCAYLYEANSPPDFLADAPNPDIIGSLNPLYDGGNNPNYDDMTQGFQINVLNPEVLSGMQAQGNFMTNFNAGSLCEQVATNSFVVVGLNGSGPQLVTIMVDGVEITGGVNVNSSVAQTIADQIVAAINDPFSSSNPEYHASNQNGTSTTITLYANPGSGVSANGLPVLISATLNTANGSPSMGGGVDAGSCGNEPEIRNCFCDQLEQLLLDEFGQNLPGTTIENDFLSTALQTALDDYFANNTNTSNPYTVGSSDVAAWRDNCATSLGSGLGEFPEINPNTNVNTPVPDELACWKGASLCDGEESFSIADYYASYTWNQDFQAHVAEFETAYLAHCLGRSEPSVLSEDFEVSFQDKEYHYTLFFYDLVGNLTRTIAPKGVRKIPLEYDGQNPDPVYGTLSIEDVANHRGDPVAFPNPTMSQHSFVTGYSYNSYNEVRESYNPDQFDPNDPAVKTHFWYDHLGRVRFSQSPEQESRNAFSYIKYDALARPYEAGEFVNSNGNDLNAEAETDPAFPYTGYQRTLTYYDNPINGTTDAFFDQGQQNLRSAIASQKYQEEYNADIEHVYDHAIHFSYDSHDFANETVQEFPELAELNDPGNPYRYDLKTMHYDYDLVTGNVNEVLYQRDQPDQFRHRYVYDADNRLIEAWTSEKGLLWDRDVEYFYHAHGPLARVELGDHKVQGIDAAFNIHGWLKGVNSNSLVATRDMGKDGHDDNGTDHVFDLNHPDLHRYIGRDEYGFSLGYYDNDYTAIGQPSTTDHFLGSLMTNGQNSGLMDENDDLYNGMVSHRVTAIGSFMENGQSPQAMSYRYDQLLRLKGSIAFENLDLGLNEWQTNGALSNYAESIGYDENGNILTLDRNAFDPQNLGNVAMDQLEFNYDPAGNNNRLTYITEALSQSQQDGQMNDLEGQVSGNYTYDEDGRLTQDLSEEIQSIQWNVGSKIISIDRAPGSERPDVEFAFGVLGKRMKKVEKSREMGNPGREEFWTYTYYVRDLAGKVLATYKRKVDFPRGVPPGIHEDAFSLEEQHLYSEERMGVKLRQLDLGGKLKHHDVGNPYNVKGEFVATGVYQVVPPSEEEGYVKENVAKVYELTNYLGSVLTVITDRQTAVSDGFGSFAHFEADAVSATDYFAHGMPMPGRNVIGEYKYGFSGMEMDNEVKGQGNALDFGGRNIYDGRMGRFVSVDPRWRDYPSSSPYHFAGNNPIAFIDENGEGPILRINSISGSRSIRKAIKAYRADKISYDDLMGKIDYYKKLHLTRDQRGWIAKRRLASELENFKTADQRSDGYIRAVRSEGSKHDDILYITLTLEDEKTGKLYFEEFRVEAPATTYVPVQPHREPIKIEKYCFTCPGWGPVTWAIDHIWGRDAAMRLVRQDAHLNSPDGVWDGVALMATTAGVILSGGTLLAEEVSVISWVTFGSNLDDLIGQMGGSNTPVQELAEFFGLDPEYISYLKLALLNKNFAKDFAKFAQEMADPRVPMTIGTVMKLFLDVYNEGRAVNSLSEKKRVLQEAKPIEKGTSNN